jgi:indolepyruvate decarboxylase
MFTPTVIQYILNRLHSIGISDIFGVAGDYAFPISDAICEDPKMRWIGCCNELNAAYAADGYARIHGMAAISTTYGVGELSAINGIAGAYAELLPVFHIVGSPSTGTQKTHALVHHTFGNGEYAIFQRMVAPAYCAQAFITPQNVAAETERLIAAARYHKRPVYLLIPEDYANELVADMADPVPPPRSDPKSLQEASDAIVSELAKAERVCILPGISVARFGLQATLKTLIASSGLPFATMIMGKAVLDEQHPNYIGIYDGRLMNEDVRAFVEGCDRLLLVGSLLTDFSTGAFTAKLDPSKLITIAHHHAVVGGHTYPSVEMGDLLVELTERLPSRIELNRWQVSNLGNPAGRGNDPISADALYPRWANFLKRNDILVAETGTSYMGLAFARMPAGVTFHNQTLWGSIGWATPAAFGAAVAAPDQRVVLVTGDGAHQLTAQEVGQFGRLGLKPVIFLLNNSGYLIERLLCANPSAAYNDVADWQYAELPHALGCADWFTARVTTCAELDQALEIASKGDLACYIEVVTDKYAASPLAEKLHDNIRTLYPA